MDKILDIGDIFGSKLAGFSVPVFAVLICAIAIFFLTRQEPRKFESSRLARKTVEVNGPVSNNTIKKKKRNIAEQTANIVLPPIVAKKKKEAKEVKPPKKDLNDTKTTKNQLSTKDTKINNSKVELLLDGEGEWTTVITKRQKKNVEQTPKKGSPKSSPRKGKGNVNDFADIGIPKLTEGAMAEQSESKAHKKNKKRALRE